MEAIFKEIATVFAPQSYSSTQEAPRALLCNVEALTNSHTIPWGSFVRFLLYDRSPKPYSESLGLRYVGPLWVAIGYRVPFNSGSRQPSRADTEPLQPEATEPVSLELPWETTPWCVGTFV